MKTTAVLCALFAIAAALRAKVPELIEPSSPKGMARSAGETQDSMKITNNAIAKTPKAIGPTRKPHRLGGGKPAVESIIR